MKACIQTFNIGIEDLQVFLTSTEYEIELIGLIKSLSNLGAREKQLLSSIASAHINRKRYIYSVAVVSLYGLLERLVDNVIEAYVSCVANSVNSYNELPEAIQKNHISLSIDLLKAIVDERHWSAITQDTVVSNLHSCMSQSIPFQLNGAAFALHRGNVTLVKIAEFLSSIGIDNHLRRVSRSDAIREYFQVKDPERDIRRISDQDLITLFQSINELVERRNQIAHGVINIDDIESTDFLKERCRFVGAYGNGLYNILYQEFLKFRIKSPEVQLLNKPIAVHNNSIVCFESGNCRIAVGNIMVAATRDVMEPFRYGSISKLEIDNKDYPEIVVSQPTKFATQVSFKASDKYDYFVFPNDF